MSEPKDPSTFYESQPEPQQGCFLALRNILLRKDERIHETVKYGMPCFCLEKKALFYLWKDKKTQEPYILFTEGGRMNHPALEQGDRARMKILRVDPTDDIPIKLLDDLVSEALALFD